MYKRETLDNSEDFSFLIDVIPSHNTGLRFSGINLSIFGSPWHFKNCSSSPASCFQSKISVFSAFYIVPRMHLFIAIRSNSCGTQKLKKYVSSQ